MKIGTRKRLTYIFSYGGQVQDLKAVLDLIAEKVISPRVTERRFEEFPQVVRELIAGKIKGRVALVHS
jgi:propanol-preferring alcohol dehydrogenase